jgi:hypothetical protein
MAKLLIKTLYRSVWKLFGFQHQAAVEEQERFRSDIEKRLGQDTALKIQRHVDVALGRNQAEDLPNPAVMAIPEFFDLLAAEMSVQEIADRISANAAFVDYDDRLLPSLGLSWQDDILPLLDGQQNPGKMPVKNVKKFLGMVRNTDGSAEAISDDFRGKRRELVAFLEKAVKLNEPIWCEL